ncbi:fumarylacetoacetate hydrolase family protein [Pseudonocardia sp. Cha107L01]|uniref:fumarylacetoacetate hydrolase family protein n=1 Tax=Pseudonocardia sp. Cha107L01 TaxID=3457576 RepID=UPI00403E7045
MRVGNLAGRATLFTGDGAVDIEKASEGRFSADPQEVWSRWTEFRAWANTDAVAGAGVEQFDPDELGAPVPRPPQVFAFALNYDDHVAEAGIERPGAPSVFTKFPSSLTGPYGEIALVSDSVDWEVELVVVVGHGGHRIPVAEAAEHIAGITAGQDITERVMQVAGTFPQFGMAKSHPGFSPVGPWVVTLDEFDHPFDLELGCAVDDDAVQEGRTRDLIFGVPELIAHLSSVVTLFPGDLIFTGTPAGVGAARTPPRFLRPGQVLRTWISGIGEMRHRLV